MIGKFGLPNFEYREHNGILGIYKDNNIIYSVFDSSSLMHGLPNTVIKPPNGASYSYFVHSAEYGLYKQVLETFKIKDGPYTGSNSVAYRRYKEIKNNIKTITKGPGYTKQDLKRLKQELINLKPVVYTDEYKAYIALQKKKYTFRARALRLTNIAIKKIVQSQNPECLKTARRYPKKIRGPILKLCLEHEYFRQICDQFPVLAIFIVKYQGVKESWVHRLKADILAGKKIKQICIEHKISYIYRKIKPATAWCMQLSEEFLTYCDLRLDKKIFTHYMPKQSMYQYRWMSCIKEFFVSYDCGNNDFLLWAAKNITSECKRKKSLLISDLYLLRDAHNAQPWDSSTSYQQAWNRQAAWHQEIRERQRVQQFLQQELDRLPLALNNLIQAQENAGIFQFPVLAEEKYIEFGTPVLPAYNDDEGYCIIPITNSEQLKEEGRIMHHCVGNGYYSKLIIGGHSYIYSVQKDGNRVGTLEICKNLVDTYKISQFRGYCNSAVDEYSIKVINKWIANGNKNMILGTTNVS